jgi:hypothetical protein
MYKYIKRDATVFWLLFQDLYQELYMFRVFTMPISSINFTSDVGQGERPKHVEFLKQKPRYGLHLAGYIYTYFDTICLMPIMQLFQTYTHIIWKLYSCHSNAHH